MILVDGYEMFKDNRGIIQDVIRDTTIDSVTFISSKDGAIRGNHYHNETIQWTYILRGQLLVVTRDTQGKQEEGIAIEGDLIMSPAGEHHAWKALGDRGDVDVLVFTKGPRSGANYELDTIRLEEKEKLL